MSFRKQLDSKNQPLLSTTPSIKFADNNSTKQKSCKKLFPVLDFLLRIIPMWVTQKRKHELINIMGVSMTLIGAIALSIWNYNGNTFIREKLNDDTNYWILQTVSTIVEPIQTLSQIIFYAKHFRYKFTTDPRDNYIIKFIKLKQENNVIVDKKHSLSFMNLLSIRFMRFVLWSAAIFVWIALFIGEWFNWNDSENLSRLKSNLPQSVLSHLLFYVLYLIPGFLHSIVIFLYLFDWKLRIRYLWKYSFKNKIESNNLVDYYDNFRNRYLQQILWIKVWMIANLSLLTVGFWIWIKVIVDAWNAGPLGQLAVTEGIGFLTFNCAIPCMCWLMAAGITLESTFIYTKTVQYLKQYHSKLDNNEYVDEEEEYQQNIQMSVKIVHQGNDIMDDMNITTQLQQIQKIQQIQTFLLYFSDNSCSFSIFGIDVSYNALLTLLVGFIGGKIIDWAVNAADL